MAKSEVVLALDVGTSSARAALFDFKGRRLARTLHQQAYPLHTDRQGKAELDPEQVLEAVRDCMKQAMAPSRDVRAVGMSCFWHSLLGTDIDGRPLTPILTWGDSRCRSDAKSLRDELDEMGVHAATGCMLRASYWPAKLRWLHRTNRALFRRVRYWISPAEWLQQKLAGEARCAIGMATGTGLFDQTRQAWNEELFDVCGIRTDQVLPIEDTPTPWNGAQWFPGIGDGAASNLGSGATEPGIAAINIGTSAALRILREGRAARAPFGLFCYRVDSRRFLVGGAVSNAGNLHAWCLRELNLPKDPDLLEALLAARPRPDHGLTVLPFWTAERAPRWNESDQGVICGITQSTTAIEVLQAITEASCQRLALIASMLESGRNRRPTWVVSGGILNSRASLQRLANVLGEPCHASREPEASLRGAAVFVLEKLGISVPPPELAAPVRPDPAVHELYQRQLEQLRMLENSFRSE